MRICVFIHSLKKHLLSTKCVPSTELSPGGLKIYLVRAHSREEEAHIIKYLQFITAGAVAEQKGLPEPQHSRGKREGFMKNLMFD